MTATTGANIYLIWYGSSWTDNQRSIIQDFVSNLGGSGWYNISATYYDSNKTFVANSLTLAGTYNMAYPYSTSLSDSKIAQIVVDALNGARGVAGSQRLPMDPNGVYFVLTDKTVTETSGFCRKYCGWHTDASLSSTTGNVTSTNIIKYAFVGDPSKKCPSSCSEVTTTTANGDLGADAMVSIIAHETSESVTDPQLNAWYDANGNENADKCAWTFSTTYKTASGATANIKLGSRDFLIQQNWVNTPTGPGGCAMHYP